MMDAPSRADASALRQLASRYAPNDTVRKPDHYFDLYEELLGARRRDPLHILELGVARGVSLLIWHDYFPNARIVGVDLGNVPPELSKFDRIAFVKGDQSDVGVLDRAVELCGGGGFDVIIDDAAHIGALAKASYEHLFSRYLRPDGFYAIEDICAPMLKGWPDGADYTKAADDGRTFPSYQFGLLGLVKQIIDKMQSDWMHGQAASGMSRIVLEPNIAIIRKTSED
jgi:hypothetical protein